MTFNSMPEQDLVASLGVTVHTGDVIINPGSPLELRYNAQKFVEISALREALEKLPLVHCRKEGLMHTAWKENWSEELNGKATHRARVFAIEEIPQEPVKIKIHIFSDGEGNYATDSCSEDFLSIYAGWRHLKTIEVEVDEK